MHQLFYNQNHEVINSVVLDTSEKRGVDKEVGKILAKMNSDLDKIAQKEFEKNETILKGQ